MIWYRGLQVLWYRGLGHSVHTAHLTTLLLALLLEETAHFG